MSWVRSALGRSVLTPATEQCNAFCITTKCVGQTTSNFARFSSELPSELQLLYCHFYFSHARWHHITRNNHYASLRYLTHVTPSNITLTYTAEQCGMWSVPYYCHNINTFNTMCNITPSAPVWTTLIPLISDILM